MAYLYHFLVVVAMLPAPQRGVVSAVALAPNPVDSGVAVKATVTGTNPCGAVHIDWGDGGPDSRTFPITALPFVQAHVYRKGGTFTVRARGMGNCDGDVTTKISVVQKEPPAEITELTIDPAPAPANRPVTMTVQGTGVCRYTIDFGDGNSDERSRPLPDTVRHNYPAPGRYTVTATAAAPCDGRAQRVLEVRDRVAAPQITELTIDPAPAPANQPVTITVHGTGECRYTIDFGDGNTDERSGTLPDTLRHNYPAPGRYTVTATATGACTGRTRRVLEVRDRVAPPSSRGQVRGIAVAPLIPAGEPAAITVEGAGRCEILIEFGDGEHYFGTVQLPFRLEHAYRAPGRYELYAGANAPCEGSSVESVRVRRR